MNYFTGYFDSYFESEQQVITPNNLPYWPVGYWATGYWSANYWPAKSAAAQAEGGGGGRRKRRPRKDVYWLGDEGAAAPAVYGKVSIALDDWSGGIAATFKPSPDVEHFLFLLSKAA